MQSFKSTDFISHMRAIYQPQPAQFELKSTYCIAKKQNTNSESYQGMSVIHDAITVQKFHKNQGMAVNKISCKGR
jgi:hypothetical protein